MTELPRHDRFSLPCELPDDVQDGPSRRGCAPPQDERGLEDSAHGEEGSSGERSDPVESPSRTAPAVPTEDWRARGLAHHEQSHLSDLARKLTANF